MDDLWGSSEALVKTQDRIKPGTRGQTESRYPSRAIPSCAKKLVAVAGRQAEARSGVCESRVASVRGSKTHQSEFNRQPGVAARITILAQGTAAADK